MIDPFTGSPILQAIGPVVAIVLVDLMLSGDNVLIIGAAVAGLPAQQQRLGIILGGGTALILRIVLTGFTSLLLRIPLLQAIGGLILVGVTVQLLVAHGRRRVLEDHGPPAPTEHVDSGARAGRGLLRVLLPALIGDLSTSLDNILAIGALARGNVPALIAGLTLSVGILLGGSLVVAELIRRLPDLVEISALILAWVATQMLLGDGYLSPLFARTPLAAAAVIAAVFGIVIGTGVWLRIRR